jgi:hypothetical protein
VLEQIHRLVPALSTALTPLAQQHGFTSQVDGVFCHLTPKVAFGAGSNPELGDLLIAVSWRVGMTTVRNALLLQFKVDSGHRSMNAIPKHSCIVSGRASDMSARVAHSGVCLCPGPTMVLSTRSRMAVPDVADSNTARVSASREPSEMLKLAPSRP